MFISVVRVNSKAGARHYDKFSPNEQTLSIKANAKADAGKTSELYFKSANGLEYQWLGVLVKLWVKLWRVRSCEARGHVCIGVEFAPQATRRQGRIVLRFPHVQTGVAGGQVPPPFVLHSAFAGRFGSRQRRGV